MLLLTYQSYIQAQGLMNCPSFKQRGKGTSMPNGLLRPMTGYNLSLFLYFFFSKFKHIQPIQNKHRMTKGMGKARGERVQANS